VRGHTRRWSWNPQAYSSRLIPVAAILVAVCVLDADFHSTASPILVVITSAVATSLGAVIIGTRPPIAAYGLVPGSPHVVVAHLIAMVVIALLRSPTATDANVLGTLTLLVARLLRLPRRALGLHGSLGLVGLAHAIETVAIALFRSPAAADPNVLGALTVLLSRLLRLLRRSLWLDRDSLGLVGRLRLALVLSDGGIQALGAEQYGG
jgi:hypothetical protein